MSKKVFLMLFSLLFLPIAVFADLQLNSTEVQLSVGDFLLDIDDSNATTDQIDFNGPEFTVTLSGGQFIKIGSADRVNFLYSPTSYSTYVSTSCSTSRSTITIKTPSELPGTIAITITPQGTCSVDGGGAGGAAPSLTTPLIPTPPPPPPPVGVPPEEIPPTSPLPLSGPSPLAPPTFPAPEPTLPPSPLPPIPIIPAPIVETVKEVSKGITDIIQSIRGGDIDAARIIVEQLRSNPVVTTTFQSVVNPLLMAIGAFGIAVVTLTAIQASATLAINAISFLQFLDLTRFFTLGLVYFKKRKPWGRVLEKLTGKPVPAALIQVFDAEFKKLKDTQLTDKEGRFGSAVGEGKYIVKVTKDGFFDKETGIIIIDKPDQILNLEIIIAPLDQEFSLDYIKRVNLMDLIKRLLDKLSPALLIIGTALSLIALIILPAIFNYILFSVYILLDILKIYFTLHFVKPFGKVLDAVTLNYLPLAVVRIFDEEKHVLLSTKATDENGRYSFLITPGKYYLTCVKAGYQPFRSDSIVYTKATLETSDIKLQKQTAAPAPASAALPAQPTTPTTPLVPPATPDLSQTPPPAPSGTTPPQPPVSPTT
jgi:hypothetical protein